MKQVYLSLLLAGLTAAPALGQKTTVNAFPKPLAPVANAGMKAPQFHLPSAIDDKKKGITMYAGQRLDQSKHRSWVKWQTGDSFNFTKIYEYIHHDKYNEDQQRGIYMGAYDSSDDTYYAFFNMHYTYGDMPMALAKVDMLTGDTTNVFQFADLAEPDVEQTAWYNGRYKYAMAYDPVNEVMYALGADYENGDPNLGYTVLYEVNLNATTLNDLFKKVKDMDGLYWDFCFDAQGNAWFAQKYAGSDGIVKGTNLVKMDGDFNRISEVKMQSEWGEDINSIYFSTMYFDNSTGDLYYLPCSDYGSTSLYKVNPTTGLSQSIAWFNQGNHFTGLYIPYLTADNGAAPARVSGLDAQADLNGAMKDTIKWVTPSKTWAGDDLANLQSVKIYRKNAGYATTELTKTADLIANSQLLATVPATEKETAMSWVDENPIDGINTYYVLAANDKGNGVIDSIRCYMGIDVPGAVSNIMLEKNGTGVDISWTAPEKGANNGYIGTEGLSYKITRLPDNVVVAENVTDTKYTDNTLGEQQSYSYTIQAVNAKGAGAIATSDPIMAGSALKTPISLAFDTQTDADRWSTNKMSNSIYFYYAGGWSDDYKCMIGYGTSNGTVEGTLISPPLYLEEGKTYRFTTDFQADFFEDAYFDLYVGVGTNSESQDGATIIAKREGEQYAEQYHREKYEDYFVAPASGTYYYTLRVKTVDKYNIFKLFGLKVDYVAESDMAATSIDGVLEAVAQQANECTVKVRNLGSKNQENYTVKLLMDNEGKMVEVGTGTGTELLKTGETADVKVSFNPPYDGVWDFYGVVVANGDEVRTNDTTAVKTVKVLEAGSQGWTNIVTTGHKEDLSSFGLFWNDSESEYSQSVYYPEEIKTIKGGIIKRIGWMYDGADNLTDRSNPVDVKIYLAHTDKKSFAGEGDLVLPSDRELVVEGQMVFEPGKDHLISFSLDTPFEYNNEQNLAVICEKSGTTGYNMCALWHIYNNDWSTGYVERTLMNSGGYWSRPELPILFLGIYDPTGVERVQLVGADVAYANGLLAFDQVVNAEVYTVGGKLVSSFKGSSARLNLAKGMYVVRATAADGQVMVKKINVK
ncbi:MAG: fibronectin type III domain-containing protein [Prevotella sp.]